MSNIQINELNTLTEINEQETKKVVGGFFDNVLVGAVQANNQLGFNILTVGGAAIGVGVGQTVRNRGTNSIVAIA